MATSTKAASAKKTAAAAEGTKEVKEGAKKVAEAKAPAKPKATKTTAPKAATTTAPAKKPATAAAAAPKASTTEVKGVKVTADRRRHYVEVAAYYMAERRGFVGGNAAEDWKAAEAEVDRLLSEGRLKG